MNASLLVLLDTGNLVLQSSNSSVIWQSFDHPGNTLLPNMLLGPGQKLQSWLAPDDPSPGRYTAMMDTAMIDGYYGFAVLDNLYIQHYEFVNYYWHSTGPPMLNINSSGVDINSSDFEILRLVIEYSGAVTMSGYNLDLGSWILIWKEPENPCNVPRMCGPNSICNNTCKCLATGFQPVHEEQWVANIFTHGCERKSPLNCGTNDDGFISVNQTTFECSFLSFLLMADLQTCKDLCLANCSCHGFFFYGDGYGDCSLFTGDLYEGTKSSSAMVTVYMRISASNRLAHRKFSSLQIGLFVGGIASLVITSLAVLLAVRRWKPAVGGHSEAGLKVFSYAELRAATKNFTHKLGSGGFGSVYGGFTGDLPIAVKKLDKLGEAEKQFRAEVRILGTIQHINLVRLLGFCSEGKYRLLVYEMAQNGSLDAHLFKNDTHAAALTWHIRHQIALDSARGIAYLHESCYKRIIHCDIKPENILLDASYNVKVADFGLAKLMGRDFSHVLTTLRGTRGYLAPEWIAGMPITSKADVYSFGMTLLELISGHRNIHDDPFCVSITSAYKFFPVRVAQHLHQPSIDLASLLDSRMQGGVDMEQLTQMAYCAIWCIQEHEDLRPSMGEVVKILEGTMVVGPPPIPKLLQCLVEN